MIMDNEKDGSVITAGYEAEMLVRPEAYYMKPFRIMGNLFFAGTREVGVHILETEEGLLMIDTGWPWTRSLMIESIYELGFSPVDIRKIIHTHAHADHFGCTNLLVRLSGAETYISAEDAYVMRSRPELLWGDARTAFVPDAELMDGDVVRLGGTKVLCKSAPGHTIGTMALFFDVKDSDGQVYRCGLHGGIGVNTLSEAYMREHRLPDMRAMYRATARRLAKEKVDITLGNHTPQNDTEGKYARMCAGAERNPFINPEEWGRLLSSRVEKLNALEEKENADCR